MGSVKLPQIQLSNVPELKKLRDNTQEIIAITGQSAAGNALEKLGPVIADALQRRQKARKDAEQVALLSKYYGDTNTDGISDPIMYEKARAIKDMQEKDAAEKANKEFQNTLAFINAQKGTEVLDPSKGKVTKVPGHSGISLGRDASGNQTLMIDPENFKPKSDVKVTGGGGTAVKKSYPINMVDPSDNTPLWWDGQSSSPRRIGDNMPPKQTPVPTKGNQEAVQAAFKTTELLPKVDKLFDSLNVLDEKTPGGARLALMPGLKQAAYPEINQQINELKQAGFVFGGKQLTGMEEKIVIGTLVPGPLDNPESRELKRTALKGYLSGQIDLMNAANLLGAAGSEMRRMLANKKASSDVLSPEKRARLEELRKKKAQGRLN